MEFPLLTLRDYQKTIWDKWFIRRRDNPDERMMMSLEWARRHGKDLFSLNIMIAEAMLHVGKYWHILPESQQIRNAIWEGVTKDGVKYLDFIPKQLIYKTDNQSMKIYLINPKKPKEAGSIISLIGGDRYNKRVGAGLKGAIVSEHSLQKPNLYDLAIEPMLKETKGWVIFNYTPRGENHATKMWDWIETKPEYIASRVTIKDTGIVTEKDLQEERERGKPEEIIQQEYFCSREGAIYGSYYGDILNRNKENVGKFPHDAGYPVHTLWDLGISDSMAIWFVQFIQKEIRIIDFYENTNYALGHYASVLQGKGYQYAIHHLPHDGNKRQLTAGERAITVQQQLKDLGVYPIKIHEARQDIYGAIQRVRSILPRCRFHQETTKDGYEALKQYQREWDENRQVFKNTPLHNWASHAADAFSILPLIESQQNVKRGTVTKKYNGRFH
jgi:phage terminase large subunit